MKLGGLSAGKLTPKRRAAAGPDPQVTYAGVAASQQSPPPANYAQPAPYAPPGQYPAGGYDLYRPQPAQAASPEQMRAEIHQLVGPPPRPRPRRVGPSDRLRHWLMGQSTPRDFEPTPSEALTSAVLLTLAALLFGLFAQMTVIGTLQHNRDQQVAYDDLRLSIAEGTTPVGPVEGAAVAKGAPIARLTIPAIGVKEVVLEGTTAGVLRSGIGHRRDTVFPGQVGTSILMGRRMTYGGPFSKLGSLSAGN